MSIKPTFLIVFIIFTVVSGRSREIYRLDEDWVCNVKNSCFECLRLPHCSWCGVENKCFSKTLFNNEICKNDTVLDHQDYGLSFEENAECSCAGGKTDLRCYPAGVTEGPECSGRGQCVCGHCFCDPVPDPENPTKIIIGEHCEFDNFSCDGPKCNEGPYSLSQPVILDDDEESDGKDENTKK